MIDLYKSGIRPAITAHLEAEAAELRDYGDYWSASSAGYCMRRQFFDRLRVPHTTDIVDEARTQRIFSVGHIFHEWIQRTTKEAKLSVAQEIKLQDEDLMVRGHIDDLIEINGKPILYDYKTVHSQSFHHAKKQDYPISHYHLMQVGTYMYMLRAFQKLEVKPPHTKPYYWDGIDKLPPIEEARILKISKDDLTMLEQQVRYSPALEGVVVSYWQELNDWWKRGKIPPCGCHIYENGFLARPAFNPYFYNGEPCSLDWYKLKKGKL